MATDCGTNSYTSAMYKLRAGGPMPIKGGNFVLHTFMAESYNVVNYTYTRNIVGSKSFRGQGGNLYSADYTCLPDKSGGYSGKIVYAPTIIEEIGIF